MSHLVSYTFLGVDNFQTCSYNYLVLLNIDVVEIYRQKQQGNGLVLSCYIWDGGRLEERRVEGKIYGMF